MPERDYTNDYQDWLYDQPREYQGKPEPPPSYAAPAPAPSSSGPGMPPTTPPRPGYQWMLDPNTNQWVETPMGKFPQTTDRPGMDFDRGVNIDNAPRGVAPPPVNNGGDNPYSTLSGGGGTAGDYWSNFQWPTFTPQQANFSPYGGRPEFKALSLDEAMQEPGLQFGITEGRKQIENSAAARGTLRSGATLKDIFDWTNNRAQQGYDTANTRKFNIWNANNDLDFRSYGTNRDTYFGNFDRNDSGSRFAFDRNQFEPAKMTFEDSYRRWKAELDAATQIATGGPE